MRPIHQLQLAKQLPRLAVLSLLQAARRGGGIEDLDLNHIGWW